jgi:hypothetical protein
MDSRVKDRGKPGTAPVLLSQARGEMRHPTTKTLARARLHELFCWQHSTLHQRSASHARSLSRRGLACIYGCNLAQMPQLRLNFTSDFLASSSCASCSLLPPRCSLIIHAIVQQGHIHLLLAALSRPTAIVCSARTTNFETSYETLEDRPHPSTHPGSDTTSALSPATTIQERVRPHPHHVHSLPRAPKPPYTGNIQYII